MTRALPFHLQARAALLLLLSLPAWAGGIVVVRSSELAPYRTLEAAYAEALQQPLRSVSLAAPGAPELLKSEVAAADLVLALGPDAARATLELKPRLWLYALVPAPGRLGLPAASTGVPMFVTPTRQVELMKALVPGLATVGVIYDPAQSQPLIDDCARAAAAAGVTVVRAEVATRQDVVGAVRGLLPRVQALWLQPDTTVLGADSFRFMVQTTLESRVPLVGFSEGMARAGAVLALEASHTEMGREAARLTRALLAGQAGTAPALEGSLFLNARSAELLGRPVPPELRKRAGRVFE